jgi:hypothetical protein
MNGYSFTLAGSRARRALGAGIIGLAGGALVVGCNGADQSTTAPAPAGAGIEAKADDPTRSGLLENVVAISGDVDPHIPEFAASIGEPNNGAEPGFHATGRRQINWDGVPAQFTNTDAFPANFFNVNSPRGTVYEAVGGTGLRVSDNNFADINPTYGTDLIPFSEPKLFAPIGSNVLDVRFFIPGTEQPAVVQSFGAVVVDVDKQDVSRLQAFDKNGHLIADVPVPTRADPDEYSLVGVTFKKPLIAEVRLILGDTPLGAGVNDVSSGGTADVVVLDDFIYSEPQPLPGASSPHALP